MTPTAAPTAPARPELLLPPNGSSQSERRPTFVWKPVEGALNYRIQVASGPGFSELLAARRGMELIIDEIVAETSFTPTTTLPYGTLYWRVQATADDVIWGDWSDVWSLRIVGRAVYLPLIAVGGP